MDHYLDVVTAGSEKARDEVKANLAEAEEYWTPLTHPVLGDPSAPEWEPDWWDEGDAAREALRHLPPGELDRIMQSETPPAR